MSTRMAKPIFYYTATESRKAHPAEKGSPAAAPYPGGCGQARAKRHIIKTMFKGIIFDFNGTLFEDYDQQVAAWDALFRKYFGRGLLPGEFRRSVYGLGNVDILDYINGLDPEKHFDITFTDEKEQEYRRQCREDPVKTVLLPGVEETLSTLKNAAFPMAIATASEITNVEFYIETFRLERWFSRDLIIYDDRTFPSKPAPDVYLRAAARLELDPADCVVCEDSGNGILSARNAGIGRIIARRSGPKDAEIYKDPELYAVIDDFRGFYPKYLED